jgi:phosphinothricin acetyltransferase
MIIERAESRDWPELQRIYADGIATGHATFTASPPESWRKWLEGKIAECCLVARRGEEITGWASLEKVSARPVYSGIAIVNIYVSLDSQGGGVGSALLERVIHEAESRGIWTLEARIFPENVLSVRLHEKLGFRVVGLREKLGRMDYGPLAGTWRDVLLLERRSSSAGVD